MTGKVSTVWVGGGAKTRSSAVSFTLLGAFPLVLSTPRFVGVVPRRVLGLTTRARRRALLTQKIHGANWFRDAPVTRAEKRSLARSAHLESAGAALSSSSHDHRGVALPGIEPAMSEQAPAKSNPLNSGRVWLLVVMGFSSGLPLALVRGTLSAWMTDAKVDLTTIGIFTAVTLPYSVKFLWAPAMDHVSLPFFGRRRGWALLFQLLLIGALFFMSTVDPASSMSTMALAAVCVAAFSASQDIVLDAYRTDILAPAERAAGATTFVLGYRIGMLVSGALALFLADHLPWGVVYQLMAGFVVVGMIAVLLAKEPTAPAKRPFTLEDLVLKPLRLFASREGAALALLFILTFKLGEAFLATLTTPFIKSLGFTNTELGTLHTVLGLVATIGGGLAAATVLPRIGIRRGLILFGAIQALTNVVYAALAVTGKSYAVLVAAVIIDNAASGLGDAAFVAFLMGLCDKRYSATQYAVFSSVASAPARVFGASAGALATWLGWPLFFLSTVFMALPGIGIAFFLKKELTEVPLLEEPT